MKNRNILRRVCVGAVILCTALSLAACGESAAETAATPEPTSAPTAAPTPTPEPLPELDIGSWEFTVANSYNSLFEYAPPYGGIEGQGIDQRAQDAVYAFVNAARAAGYELYISVAFRNWEYLENHYGSVVRSTGSAEAAAAVFLPPGCSDHQTGLAIDFTDDVYYRNCYQEFEDDAFKETEAYAWLTEHCAEYGFILRYPEGKEEYYGTACNHAHFRYVGLEAAQYITEHGLCLEEFLLLYDPEAVFVPALEN